MTILAEAGDLRRFRHHRQFLKFCGMDLATVQSGMFRGQSRLSKYGNARLRRTLWVAGQAAVLKRTNSFCDKFERYISKDRRNPHLRRKAYTAIAAKMARTAHAVVKHGEPYRPFFGCFGGTFSPSRFHSRSTRPSLTCQPASLSRAATRRYP